MRKKEELLDYCRNILHGTMSNYPLRQEDFNFLMYNIFPLHDRFNEKCGGKRVRAIIVHPHPEYKRNKCFAMVMEDNSLVDISFIECINKKGLKENIEAAGYSAIGKNDSKTKKIIKDWVETFELGEIAVGKYLADYNTSLVHFNNPELIENLITFYNGRTKPEGAV